MDNITESLYQPIKQTLIDLVNILKQESELLDLKKIDDLHNLQSIKKGLSDKLESLHARLQLNTDILQNLSPYKKQELWELNKIFEEIAENNMKKLEKAMSVNQAIIESLKRELIKNNNNEKTYTKTGTSIIDTPALLTGDMV